MNDRKAARRRAGLRHLLTDLAVGEREPVVEPEEWFRRLHRHRGSDPVRRWFLCALRHEWPNVDPPTGLCADVAEHVEGYLARRPGPWANLWGHIRRVTGYALQIGEAAGADDETVFLTAILHDVRKLDERDEGAGHEEMGAIYARRLLAGEVPGSQLDTIVRAIGVHPDRPPLGWRTACALHDADKLDKVGATGLLRRASLGEDLEEACEGAWRMLDDLEYLPALCFRVSEMLLAPKRAFAGTLEGIIGETCDE